LTLYATVLNLLNTANIQNVWITTGLADDTGYTGQPTGKAFWDNASDTIKSLYKMREIDYNNYGIPRQIRIGVQLEL